MTEFLQTDSSHVVNVDEEIITNITEKILEYGFPFEALFSLAVLLTHFIFYFRRDFSPQMFDTAAQSVFTFVRYGTFEQWQKSDLCKKALADCGASDLSQLLGDTEIASRESGARMSVDIESGR